MDSQQMQLALFDEKPTLDKLLTQKENQYFDRKSIRIKPDDLAECIIGFANADGGRIAVGISNGTVEGIDGYADKHNALLQAGIDFTSPCAVYTRNYVDCLNSQDQPDRVLIFDIPASDKVHRNKKQECFLRIGDENRRLSLAEERELGYDKDEAKFDKTIAEDVARSDLDMDAIHAYAQQIHATDLETFLRSRCLYLDGAKFQGVTHAGWLLFGKIQPVWSYVRYLRYDGITAETGSRSNLMKDERIEGTLPTIIAQAKTLLTEELQVIRLLPDGRFGKVSALPEFAWLEAIVNAVTHRSYSLSGDGIRVTQFSDRLEVHSPGRLPGLVRVENIRNGDERFSRNPHIARVLAEMTSYVRELNEGVKRMFQEMTEYGLREPVYRVGNAHVLVTLYKLQDQAEDVIQELVIALPGLHKTLGTERLEQIIALFRGSERVTTRLVAQLFGVAPLTARSYLTVLEDAGLIVKIAKSKTDPSTHWKRSDAAFWIE